MKFLILGMIGLFVGAAVTEFPIRYSLELAVFIALLSLWLIAANMEYISREYRLIKSLERERYSLSRKIVKLQRFLCSDKVHGIDAAQLVHLGGQLNAMQKYRNCLDDRIENLRGV
jgi:hypothetical protein